MAGLVFRVCMGGPNISGVQISRDRTSDGTLSKNSGDPRYAPHSFS